MFQNLKRSFALFAKVSLLATTLYSDTITLTLAQTWPKNMSPLSDAPIELARLVDEMSDGQLKIRVDSSEKHKSPLGIFDMVRTGQYDLGHSASYYWKGKVENTMYFTTLPFGMTAVEQYGWFYHGGGMKLMNKLYSNYNLISYPGGNTGVQMGGWFRKEIKSIDDLKGLKMRIPGFAGEVFAKVGAVPTNIPAGELFMALDRGTIDALEWVGPSMDLKMGFHKVAKYYYTGWHEPGSEMQFLINKQVFEKLPQNFKTILTTAMEKIAYDTFIKSMDMSATNWEIMKNDFPQIEVKTFPLDVLKALKKANNEILNDKASKDSEAKEIITSRRDYLNKIRTWTKMSDYTYLKTMEEIK